MDRGQHLAVQGIFYGFGLLGPTGNSFQKYKTKLCKMQRKAKLCRSIRKLPFF
jgi:hypothetical protein